MTTNAFRIGAAVVALVTVTGCVVGPDYVKPEVGVPSQWSEPLEGGEKAGGPDLAQWWRSFGDAELDSLIERGLESNFDLRVSEARIREARATETLSAADLWPALNSSAGYQRMQSKRAAASDKPGFGGASATFSQGAASVAATLLPGGAAGPSVTVSPDFTGGGGSRVTVSSGKGSGEADRQSNVFQAGFDARWELDLFGGVRRENEAARASREAIEESLRDVQVSLSAEIARQYFTLRQAQASVDIFAKNMGIQQETLELVRSRFDAGLTGELDVKNAEAQLAATEAAVPAYAAQVQYAIHRLGVLIGGAPGVLQDELAPVVALPPTPPEVPVGLPADLLRRRPDVRRAERELAAATARIGVATSDLFPKVSLTGSFSGQDDALYGIKRNANMMWSIGPGIQWPIFDAGRIRANIRIQNARQEQAFTAYEKAVMTSLEDAENALVGFAKEQNRLYSLEKAVEANNSAVALAKDLYAQGLVNFLSVLDAERSLSSTEEQCIQSRAAVLVNLAALFKALGGGWDETEVQQTGE